MTEEIARTRELLLKHGWNTTCYQIVNPGIKRWFSTSKEAVVGYVRKARVRVVAGAPVCAEDDLDAVIKEFEADAQRAGDCVCYFGAEQRLQTYAEEHECYSAVVLGAQPVWRPNHWLERFNSDPSLRAQRSRAKNKGVVVTEWPADRATNHAELQRVLSEWLATRGLPPMHFLVEPETLGLLDDRRVFVAELKGRPVGFTILCPVPDREGWLTEQFIRGKDAPNGTVELLVDTAVAAVSKEGAEFVTMGIVPLARCAESMELHNPWWLRLITAWARAHGRRFYNFEGLEWFKEKFHPDEWEPIYVISRERKFSARTLYAIAAAFTGGSPLGAILRGFGKAVKQEVRWATRAT